ncbi:hypothetical protein ACWEOO_23455 [Kribbella sp. NPDC004138]
MRRRSVGRDLVPVAGVLVVVATGLGLVMMPGVVGADWPGWTSLMVLVAVLVIPVAWVLIGSPRDRRPWPDGSRCSGSMRC